MSLIRLLPALAAFLFLAACEEQDLATRSLEDLGEFKVEQLSFLLGAHYLISFQEEVGDHFDGVRFKLTENLGILRKKKCDILLAQLLDAILDNYFETIDKTNQEIVSATVGADRKSVHLVVKNLQAGHVHHLKSSGVRSKDGDELWHKDAYYTINEFPK